MVQGTKHQKRKNTLPEGKIDKTFEDRCRRGFSKQNLNCTRNNTKNQQVRFYQTKVYAH